LLSFLNIVFLLKFKPNESVFLNRLEAFNELLKLIISYHQLCFTDFIYDSETKGVIGWYMVGFIMFSFAINFFIMLKNMAFEWWSTFVKKRNLRNWLAIVNKNKFEQNRREFVQIHEILLKDKYYY
jgi:hypothetical protein